MKTLFLGVAAAALVCGGGSSAATLGLEAGQRVLIVDQTVVSVRDFDPSGQNEGLSFSFLGVANGFATEFLSFGVPEFSLDFDIVERGGPSLENGIMALVSQGRAVHFGAVQDVAASRFQLEFLIEPTFEDPRLPFSGPLLVEAQFDGPIEPDVFAGFSDGFTATVGVEVFEVVGVAEVPVPASLFGLFLGLTGLVCLRRRAKSA